MNELTIPLNKESNDPIYLQIYNYIKNEIRGGSLKAGQKLPSTRALAQHLGVARSTVDFSYGQLLSEGYIESVSYKGHFVCEIMGMYSPEKTVQMEEENVAGDKYKYDFSPNSIDITAFPFDTWRRITKKVFLDEEKDIFSLGDAKGDFRLRKTICNYLHNSRGVTCSPNQIIVGAGNDYLLMLLQKILGTEKSIAVENPAYMRAARIFSSGGYKVCPVELDECGMRVDLLQESAAEIAYITPSRQFPTGTVMTIGRRMEILKWANSEADRYIIEDDYDSEFRYKGMPIPALQAVDQNEKVIYLGTFSKAIAPAIRISYMVLPNELLKKYEENLWFVSSTVSRIDQAILYHFIEEGHFERYLNKMRKIYKGKHDLLMQIIKSNFNNFEIYGENAGLHIVLKTKNKEVAEGKLISMAARADCKVYGMSDYLIENVWESEKETQVILGYAAMSEQQIEEGLSALKKVWKDI